jgi:hypothetical protein
MGIEVNSAPQILGDPPSSSYGDFSSPKNLPHLEEVGIRSRGVARARIEETEDSLREYTYGCLEYLMGGGARRRGGFRK